MSTQKKVFTCPQIVFTFLTGNGWFLFHRTAVFYFTPDKTTVFIYFSPHNFYFLFLPMQIYTYPQKTVK